MLVLWPNMNKRMLHSFIKWALRRMRMQHLFKQWNTSYEICEKIWKETFTTYKMMFNRTLLPALETTNVIGNTENKQDKRNMSRYFQHSFMLFPKSFGYLFYDTYSFFCIKCCIVHLLCVVSVFRLSEATDYCNVCYHWRQNFAIGTEVLIFKLVFLYGRGTCFRAMVTTWTFQYNIKSVKKDTYLNKYWKKQTNANVTYWFASFKRV